MPHICENNYPFISGKEETNYPALRSKGKNDPNKIKLTY
jgi:hypothetical protein